MHNTSELLKELRQRGFDARLDETGVVTVWVDPYKDDTESINRLSSGSGCIRCENAAAN